MAYLINRNPPGRTPFLHGLLQYLVHHWGRGPYRIKDLYFDPNRSPDIHDFSPCSEIRNGEPSCMFLQNSSSDAKCGNVNSVLLDTQKGKNISDNFNALDGLGLITRTKVQDEQTDTAVLTDLGWNFVNTERDTFEWEELFREAVLNYGPFIGFYAKAQKLFPNQIFKYSSIPFGYPEPSEKVVFEGEPVTLSAGSKPDSTTRTRSSLSRWGLAAGFFKVADQIVETPSQPSQVENYSYLMSKVNRSSYCLTPRQFFPLNKKVDRPLSYENLTKDTRSLRERGQQFQREATLFFEEKIRNRRLAIVFLLSTAFEAGKVLNFDFMVEQLSEDSMFVVQHKDFAEVMRTELDIAYIAGAPFKVIENLLQPLCKVNLEVLCDGAPTEAVSFLESISQKSNMFISL